MPNQTCFRIDHQRCRAYESAIAATLSAQRANFEAWEAVSRGTEFPVGAAGQVA